MSIDQDRDRKRGLPAVHAIRAQRKTGRFGRTTINMVLYAALAIAAVMFIYNAWEKRALEAQRRALTSEVRAGRATIGAQWEPLRDLIEGHAGGELRAAEYPGDRTDPGMESFAFRDKPSLYVRMRLADVAATDNFNEAFRRAALYSVHDGFTSCLYRAEPSKDPKDGILSEQPWNLKRAYQAVRVLGDDWLQEVESADSQLRLRAFVEQWQKARDTDIPQVIEMMTRATSLVLLYDEDVPQVAEMTTEDGGAPGMPELQLLPHPVRIQVVDLAHKKIARRRVTVDASYHLAGESDVPTNTDRSLKRQVQNCQLAKSFLASLTPN